MDALSRISAFFPTNTLTSFYILSNVIINDSGDCEKQQRQLMIALLIIFCALHFVSCFTDSYSATNNQKFWVVILPFYGPICFSLPTDFDKDRVYEYYYLKIRDYVHGLVSTTAFLLVAIFTNPICMCLFPSTLSNGTSRFDPAIVRTVPIVVAIITSLVMVCLGPPRQMLGVQNVPESSPPLEKQMGHNPIYDKYPGPAPSDRGEYDGDGHDGEEAPPPHHSQRAPHYGAQAHHPGPYNNKPPSTRESYNNKADMYPQQPRMPRNSQPVHGDHQEV